MARDGKDMELKILDCRHVYHGRNTKGDQYDIWEVDAQKGDGTKISEKLRSFTALPVGQVVKVTVVAFNSERHGRSFTLYPQESHSVSPTQAINALTERMEAMEGKVRELFGEVTGLKQLFGQQQPGSGDAIDRALDEQHGTGTDGQGW